jgi:ATP-dependent protease ClpP protease subunit
MSQDKVRSRIEEIHEYGIDMQHFTLYLQGVEEAPATELEGEEPGVEFRMANRFIRSLDVLSGLDAERPIIISMKTNGGDWAEGMAIYDAIMAAPNPVTIVNYTHARSMSSIIFEAANKRIMMPHSTFMFHMGTYGIGGTWKVVFETMKFDADEGDHMLDIYVDRMKATPESKVKSWSKKRIKEWLIAEMDTKEDVYLRPEDAVAWGFADEIFTGWDTVTDYTPDQRAFK